MDIKGNRIAHRGAFNNTNIPENSLKAFKKAVDLGIAIELDVQLTKDNVLIVFHDDNIERMTKESKNISDMTLEETQSYPLLDTKEKIPTLQKVLDLVKEKVPLLIEVKSNKNYKMICNLLMQELENYHNYVIQSFDPRITRYLKKQYPSLEVGYIIHKKHTQLLSNNLIIRYSKADFLAIHKSLLNKKKYQKLKEKYKLLLWTIQNTEENPDKDCILICNNVIS